jgi:Holliday junction DNA helicase RuvB
MLGEAIAFFVSMGDLIWGKKDQEQKPGGYRPDQVTPLTYRFRPRNLNELIGQPMAKALIRLNIEKIRRIKSVHFIISGTQGTGKSTTAYIIANELQFKIHTYIGGSFTMDNLTDFLCENETGIPHVLFIDEVHGLAKEIAEFMYPILEDFLLPVGNVKIRPFIFIGATTEKNTLQKKFSPLVDRYGADILLEHYSPEDIKLILKQYNAQTYKANLSEEVYDTLSVNTRFNPRISIALFDDYMVCKDMNQVLKAHRIIKNSLTTNDVLILEHLLEINKPVGVETLAIIIQQTKEDYQGLVESFLLQQGYISRTARGRVVTEKDKRLLQEIEE